VTNEELSRSSDSDTGQQLDASDPLDDETLPSIKAVNQHTPDPVILPTASQEVVITPSRHNESNGQTHLASSEGSVATLDTTHIAKLDEDAEATSLADTFPLPAFHLRYITLKDVSNGIRERATSHAEVKKTHPVRQLFKFPFPRDGWLIATFMSACCAGILALWYFFEQNDTLLYGDANSHLLIARRILDNTTPGLAQLGGIWLPLPHLLMVPLVWNDYLWRTGLAGSIVSLISYIVAAVYVFLSARRLTKNSAASFVGTLVFILNPNILYLQSTPLSELVLIATLTAACYYFLVWAQTDAYKYLIMAAGTTFLATLSRYDGWVLFIACLALIMIIGWLRQHSWPHIEGNLLAFGSLGGLGIILWFIWNALIFGDPLYFQHGPFSAEAQQLDLIHAHLLYTYHNLGEAIRYYMIDCSDTVGFFLLVLGAVALLLFFMQRRFTPETLATLAFLVPIPFYILSLYTGQASLYLPTAVPGYAPYHLFNARYGEVVVVPIAIFLAFLASFLASWLRQASPSPSGSWTQRVGRSVSPYLGPVICTAIIIAQTLVIVNTGIITLQDGQYGLACTPTHSIVIYLAEHYAGGRVLEDLYTSKIDTLEATADIHFKDMIYEGSGQLWTQALKEPQKVVDWIIVNPQDPSDAIAKNINLTSQAFTTQFSFVLQEKNGLTLYYRNGLPPLPFHTIARSVFTTHSLCNIYNSNQSAYAPTEPGKENAIGQQVVFKKNEAL
jgi:hypothetical protein